MGGVQTTSGITLSGIARKVQTLWRSLFYSQPLLNNNLGEEEPPTSLRLAGYLAYADGSNWNPAGDGTAGFFYWNGIAWTGIGSDGGGGADTGIIPSGASLPGTPADWQMYIHITGGRNYWKIYDGSAWQTIRVF